jgi:hypothetical protein
MRARIEELDRRTQANHDTIASVRNKANGHDGDLRALHVEFSAQREDMGELKEQGKWIIRGLVGATVTFTGLIITIVLTLANHG